MATEEKTAEPRKTLWVAVDPEQLRALENLPRYASQESAERNMQKLSDDGSLLAKYKDGYTLIPVGFGKAAKYRQRQKTTITYMEETQGPPKDEGKLPF